MKMKLFFAFAASLLILASACQKSDDDVQSDASTELEMKQEAIAEVLFDEVFEISNEGMRLAETGFKNGQNFRRRIGDCATITIDTTVMPRVMTIDFGEENCLCPDGKNRRGQIIVTFNGRFHQPGTVITQTFNNYHVNDNHIQGSRVRENLGLNEDGHPHFICEVDGSVTLAENGTVISRVASHMRTWIEGFGTPTWVDDVHLIEGEALTENSNGFSSSRTILLPLRRELSCHHFVSGTVEIERTGRPLAILDYGDGECDNIATVTIGDNTFTIRLP